MKHQYKIGHYNNTSSPSSEKSFIKNNHFRPIQDITSTHRALYYIRWCAARPATAHTVTRSHCCGSSVVLTNYTHVTQIILLDPILVCISLEMTLWCHVNYFLELLHVVITICVNSRESNRYELKIIWKSETKMKE